MTLSSVLLAAALPSMSLAAEPRPHTIAIQVQDVSGAPIGHARVLFPVEGDFDHAVNDYTGVAKVTALYPPDNQEVLVRRGQVYAIEVTADGYAPQQTTVRVDRRKTQVIYTLLETGSVAVLEPSGR
jgi:hypothetical protein